MKTVRIAFLLIMFLLAMGWATRLVVVLDDGFRYKPIPHCEVTIFGSKDDILFYGYTDYNGVVHVKGLDDGSYRGTLRALSKTYYKDIEIDNSKRADTLIIYERR